MKAAKEYAVIDGRIYKTHQAKNKADHRRPVDREIERGLALAAVNKVAAIKYGSIRPAKVVMSRRAQGRR